MKTKIFISFIIVIMTALISSFIFKWLIIRDFDEYTDTAGRTSEYWIKTAVEESYVKGRSDHAALFEALHWGLMLGFDFELTDSSGHTVMNSETVLQRLKPTMKKRMEESLNLENPEGEYSDYKIKARDISGSLEYTVGMLRIRPLAKYGLLAAKEEVLKNRAKYFMLISFVIAGGGSVILALLFSTLLSNPLKHLKEASIKIANREFDVKVPVESRDEIGSLASSFNYMAEALSREDRFRKHLMTNITHELRTPLTIMKANIEAMADGVVENISEGLNNLREGTEKLISLVRGIEDITKAEEGFFKKGEYKKINLREFLNSVLANFSPMAVDKAVELVLYNDDSIDVTTDSEKLSTIAGNLISNAVLYTEKGSVTIEYGKGEKEFYINVKDTGAGISDKERDMIFSRFYRGRASKGMGIGLSIVKELVEIMDGEIVLESGKGQGALFQVRLPLLN